MVSQWPSFLDLVARLLRARRVAHGRLDGRMTSEQRCAALARFRHDAALAAGAAAAAANGRGKGKGKGKGRGRDPPQRGLLVSLRAGGLGLNLTTAQTVYIMEPAWNPAAEAQARKLLIPPAKYRDASVWG